MGVRENKVELRLDRLIKEMGGVTRKWVSPGRDGVPDRIVIHQGRVWFVEIKTANGALSVVQTREHERLRAAGASVRTVYGAVDVLMFINEVIDNASA